jgi:hypothetical protein
MNNLHENSAEKKNKSKPIDLGDIEDNNKRRPQLPVHIVQDIEHSENVDS